MKDNISQARLLALHPRAREDFRMFIEDAEAGLNIKLRIAQGMRTMAEQQALYNKGRTTAGAKVTNAKAGSSYHNYGLAIDLVVMDGAKADWNYDMKKLTPYADKHEIKWGGNWRTFKDTPHFEKTFGIEWREMLKRYQDKNFILNTEYIIL